MRPFNPANWYWNVGNSSTQVYSSAAGNYVPLADPTYQAWLAQGNKPSATDSEASLGNLLQGYGLRPANANVLAGYQAAGASGVNKVILQVLFNHENRIRALAGQQTITAQQFLTAIASLL